MAETTLQYGQIYLGSRIGMSQGPFKVTGNGLTWKTNNGGKTVEIKKDDMEALYWTKSSRGCQLGVRVKHGPTTNFIGFREKDLESLREFTKRQLDQEIQDLPMCTSGRNWGGLAVSNGGSLMFMVDGKVAMEVPLRDVSSAQESKGDVVMEFHADDTAADERQDVITEMAFHVPASNGDFASDTDQPAAKNLLDQLLQFTDSGAAATDDAVCEFSDCAVLNPRGRFDINMHLSFLGLVGQTQDFKIRYASIQRLFILPKSNTPHTLVVVSLDPPIRKGQTYYTHVLCQFPSHEDEVSIDLELTPEQLAAKNEKCGGKLDMKLSGPVYEVFARALRGLSGAKISRPGAFRNAANDGSSIRCSYKADDGHLYPLDRAFFYVHKPPMLLPFDEIESVEFARQGGGVVSSRTFDLVVRMKTDTEHQFRNINRTEWQTLLDFFNSKKLRIENLNSAAQGPGGIGRALDVDDDFDPGMRRAEAEIDTEEDDEDFDAAAASGGGSASEDIDSDGDVDSSDAEMVPEEGISVAAVMTKGKEKRPREEGSGGAEKPKKAKASPGEKAAKKVKEPKAPKEPKAAKSKDEGDGKKVKKPRKKKDPNAPKKNMSAFMFFSSDQRNKVKEDNPGIAFGEIGKVLGEQWKALTAEDKVKYDQQAAGDKERYVRDMAAYKASGSGAAVEEEEAEGSEPADE